MRPRFVPCLAVVVWLLAGMPAAPLSPASGIAVPPRTPERGFPLIQVYDPTLPEAETQNFGIARDSRGLLYFANVSGVLVYDGAWWQLIPIGRAQAAFSIASDASGRIGVGGIDELGYLAPDAEGTLRYVSLLDLLPPEKRKFGQVSRLHPTADGFVFQAGDLLLVWDGARITVAAELPSGPPFATSFEVGSEVYVWMPSGLFRLAGTRLDPIPGGEQLRGRRIDQILPAPARPGEPAAAGAGRLLISVRGEGLFLFQPGGRVEPFAPEASRWTASNRLFCGTFLPDGSWALGSIVGGLLLLRPDGQVDRVIDASLGLPDDYVGGMVLDREGALWLALNRGIARIDVASPLSVFDRRSGLQGRVYNVARHRGDLWVGTASGVFTTGRGGRGPGPGPEDGPDRLHVVPGLPPAAWSLLSLEDDLLVGTAFGLYRVHGESPRVEQLTEEGTVYLLVRSAADPERVWVGTEEGLSSIRREGARWRSEGRIQGATGEVRSLIEKGNVVWYGTTLDGVIRVEGVPGGTPPPRVSRIGGGDTIYLSRVGPHILAVADGGLRRLDESRRELVVDPSLAELDGRGPSTGLAEDAAGNLWSATRPPTVLLRRAGRPPELRSLFEIPSRSVDSILPEPDGTVWLSGDNGLIRYVGSTGSEPVALPAPRLTRVTVGGNRLLFGGAPGAVAPSAELAPDVRRLRIEFGPLSFRAGLRYQSRLDPVDSDWNAPSAEPFAELTRLPPGSYTFLVRTVGPNQDVGPETAWSFRIQPPWYQTPWAFALGLGIALLGLRAYGRLRSRAISQRAAQLEARVTDQTVELRHTVEELRRAQVDLEEANARLEDLSLQDDLTGIANRRRLQQVLEQEWSRAQRQRMPIGFCLLDLDHFKRLNDTRGHLEGDLCLQIVARYLAEAVQGTGDLAARYGGEEFAVLLPGTGPAGALRIAEQLRFGIESLEIPHETSPEGRVTASFGVAAWIPEPGQRLETLIEAADLALYRAKDGGRNQVREAKEEGFSAFTG